MQPDPSANRSSPTQFRSKLATYLTGVMIGFLMLGMIYYFKHLAVEREKHDRAQQTTQPATRPHDQQTPAPDERGSADQTGTTP